MEIQQHNGVVVEAAGISAGLRQASARGRGVAGGEGGARGCHVAALPPPTIYRVPGGGRRPWEIRSPRGAAAKGWLPPQAKWGAPHPQGFQP